MNYSLLIYTQPEDFATRQDPAKQAGHHAAWMSYIKTLHEAGVFVAGAGLEPPETATTLTLGEERQVQDGPYADTKEQLAGLFILNLPDLDAALDWASRMPLPPGRKIEVRPNLAVA